MDHLTRGSLSGGDHAVKISNHVIGGMDDDIEEQESESSRYKRLGEDHVKLDIYYIYI